jgi:phosphatidylglycerol---prolipoprotein diacylglyceryl transferase
VVRGVITINIDPFVGLGPLTLAWHGIMTAVGLAAGAGLATVRARELRLDSQRVVSAAALMAVAGVAGARVLWLAEHGRLLQPAEWAGTRGYSIYGGILAGVIAGALYLLRDGATRVYLDALAAGFPLGLAVGRVGDVINGEHFGPPSDLPWAFRYTHPDAEVPSAAVAYHSGGFYEVVLGLAMLAVLWPLRRRLGQGLMFLTVIALYSGGRFVMFFWRSDSEQALGGLDTAQLTSLALLVASLAAIAVLRFTSHTWGRPPPAPNTLSGGVHEAGAVIRGSETRVGT